MKKSELQAFAGAVAMSIETNEDLNQFSYMLTKITNERTLNVELEGCLGIAWA